MEIIIIELGFDDHITTEIQSHMLPSFHEEVLFLTHKTNVRCIIHVQSHEFL